MRRLGLDLGGSFVKWAVVDDDAIVAQGQEPTSAEEGPAAVVERLVRVGLGAVEGAGPVEAVGVGLPGLFDQTAGVTRLLANLAGDWDGVPVVAPLREGLGLPVAFVNDAYAFALAEWRLGAARGCNDAAFAVVGTGVGGALLLGGRLHLGFDGTAGGLGHQTIDPDGPQCSCGNRGCVEALAGTAAILAASKRASVPEAISAARAGDPKAVAAFERAGRTLGIGIANIVVTLAPEVVVVGGGVAEAGELLLAPLREELDRRVAFKPYRTPAVPARFGPLAGAVGAALHAAVARRASGDDGEPPRRSD